MPMTSPWRKLALLAGLLDDDGNPPGGPPSGSAGGELAGTYPNPTVASTHSGSSHAGVVTAHEGASDPHTGYALESALGTLATQSGTFSGTSSGTNTGDQNLTGHAIYGDGSDGAVTFSTGGSNTAFATRSSLTWTLTRDVYATSVTIDSTVIVLGYYRIFCTGTFTNNGTLHHNGNTSSSSTGASASTVAGTGGGSRGGDGVASGTTTVAGTAGTVTAGSDQGGVGGTGGNANGAAGASITPTALVPGVRDPSMALMQGYIVPNGTIGNAPTWQKLHGGSGGGGGGRTTGGTATVAGGAGGGAGCVLVAAKTIDNSGGTISANGGNGAAATGGTCATGGGGGGGGGAVWLIYDTLTPGIETASGGTKGASINGAAAATDGNPGIVVKIVNV